MRMIAEWPGPLLTTGQYTELAKTLLIQLQGLHSRIASLGLLGRRGRLVPLVPPFDGLYEALENDRFGHSGMTDFRNLDGRKRLTPQSTNCFGMTMTAFSDSPESEPRGSSSGDGRIKASLSSGSPFPFA